MRVMDSETVKRDEAWRAIGHYLACSFWARVFLAPTVAIFFFALAYLAWNAPKLSAIVVTVWLVVYGIHCAGSVLPISKSTRARWTREQELARQCPASDLRVLFWAGLYLIGQTLWSHGGIRASPIDDFIVPAAFILIGLASSFTCRLWIRSHRHTATHSAGLKPR